MLTYGRGDCIIRTLARPFSYKLTIADSDETDERVVAEQKLAEGADEVFVNGDFFTPNAKALEPVFKGRMFAEVRS